MRPRLARAEDDPFEGTCDNLRELAQAYAPTLLFSTQERLYPLLAESWLGHATYAPWPGDDAGQGLRAATGSSEHHRGTALVAWRRNDDGSIDLDRIAGAPNPHGRPLQLSTSPGDPDAVGRYVARDLPVSFVFGGWRDPASRTEGDREYLERAFSELGAAMNPSALGWHTAPDGDEPTFWIHQPVTPTTYAEISWTGAYPRLSHEHGHGDFALASGGTVSDELDEYLQITYYYLFAARDGATSHEGQWQAVTVFFRARPAERGRDELGLPTDIDVFEPPVAVALSREIAGDRHESQVVTWDVMQKFQLQVTGRPEGETLPSTSALVYVTRGTHAFHPNPESASGDGTYHPPGDAPGESSGTSGDDLGVDDFTDENGWLFWVIFVILLVIFVLLVILVGWLIAAAAAALAVVAAIVGAIIAALLALFSLFAAEDYLDDDGEEPHHREENEEATGAGPNAAPGRTETDGTPGPASDPAPSGGHDDPTRTGADVGAGQYAPGVGDQEGRDSAPFDVRVVDVVHLHDHSPFPPPPARCELPSWWWYSGGWGAPMVPGSGWVSGKRRYDGAGRSWSYWHAADLEVARHRE